MFQRKVERMKRLKFSKEKCIGCQLCAQVCSGMKEGAYIPSKARIDIETYYDNGNLKYKDSYCILCGICAKACPVQCITLGEYLTVDWSRCIGCGTCQAKCPKKVIKIIDEKAYICDTCQGNPTCVQICPQHALTFE
jgi:ferredoxin